MVWTVVSTGTISLSSAVDAVIGCTIAVSIESDLWGSCYSPSRSTAISDVNEVRSDEDGVWVNVTEGDVVPESDFPSSLCRR